MACITAVGIYDDLTSGKTCITVRSADDETSGRIDEVLGICIQQFFRENRFKYEFLDILVNLCLCHIGIVLGRKNYCL